MIKSWFLYNNFEQSERYIIETAIMGDGLRHKRNGQGSTLSPEGCLMEGRQRA